MKRILLTTLISLIFAIITIGIISTVVEHSIGTAIYAMILMPGSLAIPFFLAVLIYSWLTKIIKIENFWTKKAIEIIALGLTLQLGLWLWAIADVIINYGDKSSWTIQAILLDYDNNFQGGTLVVFILSLVIVVTNEFLNRKEKLKTIANKK